MCDVQPLHDPVLVPIAITDIGVCHFEEVARSTARREAVQCGRLRAAMGASHSAVARWGDTD